MATLNTIKKSVMILAACFAAVTNLNAQKVLKSDTLVSEKNGSFEIVIRQTVVMNDDLGREGTYVLTKTLGGQQLSLYKAYEETTSESPQTESPQSARQSAMNMAGHGNSKGCFHVGIYADNAKNQAKNRVGKLWMSNCNGFELSAGPEVQWSQASSELGDYTNVIGGVRAKVAYKYYWVTPSISYFKGNDMSIEDRSFKSDEFTFAIDLAPFHHWTVSPYVGANYTHRLLRSRKEVSLEGYELNLPYKGKAGSIGAEAGVRVHLGHTTHHRTFSDGAYKYQYEKRGELYLDLQARYNHYNVEKLKAETVQSNLAVDVVSFNATLVWRLPLGR